MTQETRINHRLATLPPKVAVPFRQLLAAGQLTEDVLAVVLDAGDLANDHSKLVGFAVGYLHLRSQGVPVNDVVRMAKSQRRRINLAWSAKRWELEHERLSRAEALDRLAAESATYDVSRFEALLPARFDGYLIRTSRRLGMEGLRQRHCVASYHPQLQAGSCAIASVFIDRQRWTVQLFATGKPDMPLSIGQIKTRLNGLPTKEIRDRIHETLGLDPAIQREAAAAVHAAEDHTYMDTLRRLLPVLREHGVTRVTVSFEGSGDNGSIEDVHYKSPDAFNAEAVIVQHTTTYHRFEDGQWIRGTELTENTLNDAIENLTYDYLVETGADWCNNDGGYGELLIDVQRGTVALDVNVRYTESTNAFSSERDIATGEEC